MVENLRDLLTNVRRLKAGFQADVDGSIYV